MFSSTTLTPEAQELLDGFRELVRAYGAPVTFTQNATGSFRVLLVFPTAGNDTEGAGYQGTAMSGVEMERAQFVAAGVNAIEDDPGQPTVYVAAREVQ